MKGIILIFLLAPLALISQAELIFESVLYVEDAMGNRDSVEFGYALNEEPNVFNTDLGEEELFTPFDSVLEIRGLTLQNYTGSTTSGMSKRVISEVVEKTFDKDEDCYVAQGHVVFMVNAKYKPITFSWNHEDFNSVKCRRAATFSTHLAGAIFDEWYLDSLFHSESVCASVNNSFTTNFPVADGFEVVREVEIEGGGLKIISGLALGYAVSPWLPTWCSIDTSLTSFTREILSEPALVVYPNPVSDVLQLGIDSNEEFLIVDLLGQVWVEGQGESADVSRLPVGVYFLKTRNRRASKFVKE